jgi:hypothetical protein
MNILQQEREIMKAEVITNPRKSELAVATLPIPHGTKPPQ